MNKTSIEWTNVSVNPIKFKLKGSGRTVNMCTVAGPDCINCYAAARTRRFWRKDEKIRFGGYVAQMQKHGSFVLMERELKQLRKLNAKIEAGDEDARNNKIFWCTQTDIFHENVPTAIIERCLEVVAETPLLIHQWLTKRSDRLPEFWRSHVAPRNLWMGVSFGNYEMAQRRLPGLLACADLPVRWASYEPAIGCAHLSRLTVARPAWALTLTSDTAVMAIAMLDWLVCGGESGQGARPFDLLWEFDARRACAKYKVPYFLKQLGTKPVDGGDGVDEPPGTKYPESAWLKLKDYKGGDESEWPEELRGHRAFPVGY